MAMRIDFQDVIRATLPVGSGNEGWIGVSPSGDDYHVVVPVDVQIAKGVMACNLPTDGTPFGGYSGWLYFRCPPYEDDGIDVDAGKLDQACKTAGDLLNWLASYQIEATLLTNLSGRFAGLSSPEEEGGTDLQTPADQEQAPDREVKCTNCGGEWPALGQFLKDPHKRFDRYAACPLSFRDGAYVFSHQCGGEIRLQVSRFVRAVPGLRSLIGTHACPGSCYHERAWRVCEASCEGSIYRRIAAGLRRGTER